MDYHLINKYLKGEASEAEVSEIYEWIDESSENKKEFMDLKKLWALTAKSNVNDNYIWNQLFAPHFRKQRIRKLYSQVAKYAAILLIVFGAGFGSQYLGLIPYSEKQVYEKRMSVSVPLGQMTNLELPDGTKVSLNSGSIFSYNGDFSYGKRFVRLSGEAYFEVSKDNEHPFVVQTSFLDFKVYGTSFNIEAYPDEKIINTTLVEGSLGVSNKSSKELLRLIPGENFRYNVNTLQISVNTVNTELYTSWKDGLITFRNEKLIDIARKVERWYNVEIVIKDPKLGEEAYFGSIMKNKPIDQLLEVLKLTSSLNYEIVSRPDKPTLIYWNYSDKN